MTNLLQGSNNSNRWVCGELCNRFVISTGAQRSGEICGFGKFSRRLFSAYVRNFRNDPALQAAEKFGFVATPAVAGAKQAAEKCGDFP
jgi:hypothetical protein